MIKFLWLVLSAFIGLMWVPLTAISLVMFFSLTLSVNPHIFTAVIFVGGMKLMDWCLDHGL